MSLFKRAIRLVLFLVSAAVAIGVGLAAFLARTMAKPTRQRLWATPGDVGLSFEDVEFPARDGVRVSGWFVPAGDTASKSTLVLVHGHGWNRLGNSADSLQDNIIGATPVDMLRLAHALHNGGHNLLMFDLRNHGTSAETKASTFGLQEANDVLGAFDYLDSRDDVDEAHVGAVGFASGANAILYSLAYTDIAKAAVLVQPVTPKHFMDRFSADMFGSFGRPVMSLARKLYAGMGGVEIDSVNPVSAAPAAATTPILYLQGNRDSWGSVRDVIEIATATPEAEEPLLVEAGHRYAGYCHLVNNPKIALDFFAKNL